MQDHMPATPDGALSAAAQGAIDKIARDEEDFVEIKSAVLAKLTLSVGKDPASATDRDWFVAAALTARDRIIHSRLAADRMSRGKGRKRVYYLSLECLIGRLFGDVMGNLGLTETVNAALGDLGVNLNRLRAFEPDAALGNGGLGRLAACFMKHMTLRIPAYGYGIRYDHGLFRQVIRDGWQHEYRMAGPATPGSSGRRSPMTSGSAAASSHRRPRGARGLASDETIEAVATTPTSVAGRVNPRGCGRRARRSVRPDAFNSGAMSERCRSRRAEAISKISIPVTRR